MDSSKIKIIIIAVLAVFIALYLGITAATAQGETVAWVLGTAVVLTCLALGSKIWLLIPFMASVDLSLRLPGSPDSLLLGQLLVLGFSSLQFLMRKLPWRLAWTELELWILVLTVFVFQVYVRNPVGVNLFGGDTVGGRPYAIFIISLVTAGLLAGLRVTSGELSWLLRVTILGGLMNTAVSVLGALVPALGYYTGASYERADEVNYENFGTAVDTGAATRVGFLSTFGTNAALWTSAFISPIKACFRPLWAIFLLAGFIAVMMSGFRNGVVTFGLVVLLGIAYRSGASGLVLSIVGGIGAVALLAVVNLMNPLPPNIQRSLTFLPGTWEQRYRDDAEGSSEWRFEVWREALLTDRWIKNKWIGDGLGFSAAELSGQMNARKGARSGLSGFDAHREAILASGDYHSGPVSTVRTIGYVGLAFFLLAQIRLAVHAHRQIVRSRNTEWLPLSMIVGIPLIYSPVFFVFIFGDFKRAAILYLLAVGMVRLLENNLPLPAYAQRSRMPVMLRNKNTSRSADQELVNGRNGA